SLMRILVSLTSVVCGGALVVALLAPRDGFGTATLAAQTGTSGALTDWLTDGGDNQRTGWQRNETILNKNNVKNLKVLWKIPTGNQVRALHSLMPVLIIGRLETANGPRQVGI